MKKLVMEDIVALANKNKFNGLEKPKNIHCTMNPFHFEPTPAYPEPILTPTSKLKRHVASKVFEE